MKTHLPQYCAVIRTLVEEKLFLILKFEEKLWMDSVPTAILMIE